MKIIVFNFTLFKEETNMFGKKKADGKEVSQIEIAYVPENDGISIYLHDKKGKKTFITLDFKQAEEVGNYLIQTVEELRDEDPSEDYREVDE